MNKYKVDIDTFKYHPKVEKEQRLFLLGHQRPDEVDMDPEFLRSLDWSYISKNDMSEDFIFKFRHYVSYVYVVMQRRLDLYSDAFLIRMAEAFKGELDAMEYGSLDKDALQKKAQTFASAFLYNKKN